MNTSCCLLLRVGGLYETLTPIFHCDAILLTSGNIALPNAKDSTFALPNAKDSTFALPNAKNTNILVSLVLGDANFLHWPCTFHFLCVDFIPVEYRWRWVPNAKFSRWACTFHVVYVNFICVGHPTQTRFSVEYGLK